MRNIIKRIATTRMVVRYFNIHDDAVGVQRLEKDYLLLGIRIWTTVVAREFVPHWARAELKAYGVTDWQSRFAQYINNT